MQVNDVASNRTKKEWTKAELLGRFLWWLVSPWFRFSPRFCWAWRRMLLRVFGATVGPESRVYPTANIAIPWKLVLGRQSAIGDGVKIYSLGEITIGDRATVSQGAHLCAGTHDLTEASRPLVKAPITIGADTWICADAFIGPGVTIGDLSVVGARAVAMRDVPSFAVAVGNPARVVRKL